ncbi:MAG: T9SS type A sorting domain-containing protein, partial [Saprospiraceae bacterium]
TSGKILGLPPIFSKVDFDEAGVGICLIYHLSHEGDLIGLDMDSNINDIQGCFDLSNAITVTRDDSGDICPQTGVGIPILNEINANGNVELKNIGNDSIDVSSYFLCTFPVYSIIGDLDIICGNVFIAPGEYLTVNASVLNYSSSDGELGLYVDNNYTDPNSIIDYVEWGSTGHRRSSIAVSANIWSTDSTATSFANDKSLLFDGEGNNPSDWVEGDANNCMENNLVPTDGKEDKLFFFSIAPNPLTDVAMIKFKNDNSTTRGTMYIYDQTGSIRHTQVISVKNGQENRVNLSFLERGIYFIKVFSSQNSFYSKFIVH